MFAGMCLNPQYFKDKIKLFVAIAPVIRLTNVRSELIKTANNYVVKKLIDAFGPEI